ncbi:DEAD/DEAH box helicase [Oligoflexus tunisiensis]|uniref:DEAD/DEAH box helicase n=1 Tax=Oligoflexus tunisiensis TaxID=708132 RepID=UPI000ACCB677|nr:DEAD/DEAH box helicase [Oligoflexus tunisiensis]
MVSKDRRLDLTVDIPPIPDLPAALQGFHPILQHWFQQKFKEPTPAQQQGWPLLQQHRNTLIAAPTGGGKTMAAFFVAIDDLFRQAVEGGLDAGIQVLYLSPLRALSNDVKKNLEQPLQEIMETAKAAGLHPDPIRIGLRTGDTTATERARILRNPPHILVTTPESLFLMLSSGRARTILRSIKSVIIDEIHALARDKRGSHLSLSLEHLNSLCPRPPVRIGLSATQKPLETIAQFLVGGASGARPCEIIDVSKQRDADLDIVVPDQPLSAVCSHEMWGELYGKLAAMIESHRSTLIFVNTRRMAERITFQLSEMLGEDAVAAHHGSLSKDKRLMAEDRLKKGEIKAIVATASLELGIDVGTIDLVCQIGSPRSIAAFVQRVGRSGHALGLKPKARLIALTRDELIECLALMRAYREGTMDSIEIPEVPFDILAQHIVSFVACDHRSPDDIFNLCREAWPFRDLKREDFDKTLGWLADGIGSATRRGAYLHWDKINHELRPRRNARLAVVMSGGAIPEQNAYRVINGDDQSFVGTVDEEFAVESQKGDVFLLGNHSWQILGLKGDSLLVKDLHGAPPTIPFWKGEAGGRTYELSQELSRLRREADDILSAQETPEWREPDPQKDPELWAAYRRLLLEHLQKTYSIDPSLATQAADFLAAQKIALGILPTQERVVYERFFDETGGMQLIVHAPFGSRINRAWGLAFRKRFCRGFDFELQASATDNGILLSVGPNQSFPLESMFKMLNPHNGRSVLIQALLDVPMFEIRWRWNATRALAVLRMKGGKRVPPHLQRYQSNDLLTAVFPQQTQCFEHRTGDLEIPDHPLVRQTVQDCLQEAMDCVRFEQILQNIAAGQVELLARDTREPSPFCYELIHANPYAFLDDAPLEERRIRALATRHRLEPQVFNDLTALDPGALSQVVSDAWPLIRDPDELYDALKQLVFFPVDEIQFYQSMLQELQKKNRARILTLGTKSFAYAYELDGEIQLLYPQHFALQNPDMEAQQKALLRLLRGQLECLGPMTARALSERLLLPEHEILAGLQQLESLGVILSGVFSKSSGTEREWCERRLLHRMHRLTIEGLREQIRPVSRAVFLRFLARHQRAMPEQRWSPHDNLLPLIEMMQGLELPASVWENEVFTARVQGYRGRELDALCQSGQVVWGRIYVAPPKGEKANRNRLLSRTTPLSFLTRSGLNWVIPETRELLVDRLSDSAKKIWQLMEQRGALFFDEINALSKLLPTQIEDGLSELMSMGFVATDSFAAVRPLLNPDRKARQPASVRDARQIRYQTDFRSGGRYAPFALHRLPLSQEERLEQWAWQLLKRYGVIFRDLLRKESLAPSWGELVVVYRTLEARGLIRGGRFVEKVGGEQFALKEAIDALRACRDAPPDPDFIVLTAADPLNWMGVLSDDPKLASQARHRVALWSGRYVAYREAGECHVLDESLDAEQRMRVERALRLNGMFRQQDPFLKEPPVPVKQNELLVREERGTKPLVRNWRKFLSGQGED